MNKFWAIFITLAWVVGFTWVINYATRQLNRPIVYKGTNIRFNLDTAHYIVVESKETVMLDAVSSDFFVLRKFEGEVVVGLPQGERFKSEPVQISGGVWIVSEGSPDIQIISHLPISVRVSPTTKSASALNGFGGVVLACIWFVGITIMYSNHMYDRFKN